MENRDDEDVVPVLFCVGERPHQSGSPPASFPTEGEALGCPISHLRGQLPGKRRSLGEEGEDTGAAGGKVWETEGLQTNFLLDDRNSVRRLLK